MSIPIPVERGPRQDNPSSFYSFAIHMLDLSIRMHNNKIIKRIRMHGTEHTISEQADDTERL